MYELLVERRYRSRFWYGHGSCLFESSMRAYPIQGEYLPQIFLKSGVMHQKIDIVRQLKLVRESAFFEPDPIITCIKYGHNSIAPSPL